QSSFGVTYNGTETINASGNWWGVNTETGVDAKIRGTGAAHVDRTPFLDVGTDTDLVTPGFQGSLATLHVTDSGAQVGSTGRIQEGIGLVNVSGTVIVEAGTYAENVTVNKVVTLLGAQHGVDARTRSGAESIVDGTTNGGRTPFDLTASDVTVDGF